MAAMGETSKAFQSLEQSVASAGRVELSRLDPASSVLLIVDMVNGFCTQGPLSSARVAGIIPVIARLASACLQTGMPALAFADSHPEQSPEFASYPQHCLEGSRESDLVDELKAVSGIVLIKKNSTNAFHEREFRQWLEGHPEVTSFIVTGCCTDICVAQLATTLKSWLNSRNIPSRVIVPRDTAETYDAPNHPAGLMNTAALYMMQLNGIETPSAIQ